ncbi:MAG: hypothetical protein WCA04_03525 [Geobacteraceae bacterium]
MVCQEGKKEELFTVLAEDIADWAERFLRAEAAGGKEAAGQVLGGIAEWLGSDLVDGMPFMPLERWLVLDALAEDLLQGCKVRISEAQTGGQKLGEIISRALKLAACPRSE